MSSLKEAAASLSARWNVFRAWFRPRHVALGALVVGGFALVVLFAFYVETARQLRHPDELIYGGGGIELLDRNGEALFAFTGESGGFRKPVRLDDISANLVNATVATEDPDFWSNPGLNVRGIGRAVYENLAFWEHSGFFKGSGGSSITQQLAKNLYIPANERSSRSLSRKLRESVIAVELSRRYSKEQILEWYLNQAFYGNGAYGVEAAAQRYFSRPAKDLTVAEAALLAAIPNAPSLYDPISHPDAARERQQHVLERMAKNGYISEQEAAAAGAEATQLRPGQLAVEAPHFAMYIRETLPRLLGKEKARDALRVVTTLELGLQHKAEVVVSKHMTGFRSRFGASNAALVAIDPATGEVLVMVGSPDYFEDSIDGQVNNAVSLNQTGSSIKPVTYLAAFTKGWSPATLIDDRAMTIRDRSGSFVLGNADNRYRGTVPVRQALGSSLNVPAVKALEYAGLANVYALAGKMGITTLKDLSNYGPSFTLGGVDATLLDMTYVFSVLDDYGEQVGMEPVEKTTRAVDPIAVLRVEDAHGRVLWEPKRKKERVAAAAQTYQITSVLSDNSARVSMFGPSNALQVPGRKAAVKTGLSDNARDAWALGYTPQLVAGVWVGNADNSPMRGATSGITAAPIWRDFMVAALEGQPALDFPLPSDVRLVQVCESTGLLPTRGCPRVVTEVFLASAAPTTTGSTSALFPAETQPSRQQPTVRPTPRPEPTKPNRDRGREDGNRGRD